MACGRTSQGYVARWSAVLAMLCIVLTSADDVITPDLSFTSQSIFYTEMLNEDLDAARKQEIKSQLEPQLAVLFKNISGFKGVDVTLITINELEKTLVANWTVRLNRNDPKFVNSSSEAIGNIVLPELEAASKQYKNSIVLDTSKHARPTTTTTTTTTTTGTDDSNNLALGLGIGLGIGIPVLALAILAIVLLARKKKMRQLEKPKMSVSDLSSTHNSGGSSRMDERNYTYNINGGFIPSISGKSAPSSVSGRSDYITPVIYDTLSLSAPSETATYADITDIPTHPSFRPRT